MITLMFIFPRFKDESVIIILLIYCLSLYYYKGTMQSVYEIQNLLNIIHEFKFLQFEFQVKTKWLYPLNCSFVCLFSCYWKKYGISACFISQYPPLDRHLRTQLKTWGWQKWHSHKFLIIPIATGISVTGAGRKIALTEKPETNLHEIKSMKEHFCGEMISLQGHCQSLRTVLWSQPCGHFLWPPVSIIVQKTSHRDSLTGIPELLINGEQRWQINKTQSEIRAVGWVLRAIMQKVIFRHYTSKG